jgi:rfaE bifunctional protein nucleotidyltransferase chain/domain
VTLPGLEVPARSTRRKIVGWDALLARREAWRREAKTVVWTNGCFDILHPGHVVSLESARTLGDVLVVGVNSDAAVRRLKGPDRPVLTIEERTAMVAALEAVDFVTTFEEDTPLAVLERLRPDVHCKGADYADGGKALPERELVERYGGRIELLPLLPGISTTDYLRRLRSGSS